MSSYDSELAETASLRNIGIVRRLWPMVRPHRLVLGLAVLGLLFIIAGDVARPWFVKHMVDDGLLGGQRQSVWIWRRERPAVAWASCSGAMARVNPFSAKRCRTKAARSPSSGRGTSTASTREPCWRRRGWISARR